MTDRERAMYEQGRKMYRRDLAMKVAKQLSFVETTQLDIADMIENAIETYSNPCEAIFDHKYLDPRCVLDGCRSLFICDQCTPEVLILAEHSAQAPPKGEAE